MWLTTSWVVRPAQYATYSLCYREHEQFVLLCLQLLTTHLALALAGSVANNVLGGQARPLRNLLFRLMDMKTPPSIQGVSILLTYLGLLTYLKVYLGSFMTAGVGLNCQNNVFKSLIPVLSQVVSWYGCFVVVKEVFFPPVSVQPVFKCVYIWDIHD